MKGKMSLGARGMSSVNEEVCDSVNELGSGVARPFRIVERPAFVVPLRPALASLFSRNLLDARAGSGWSWGSAVLRRVRFPSAFPVDARAMVDEAKAVIVPNRCICNVPIDVSVRRRSVALLGR